MTHTNVVSQPAIPVEAVGGHARDTGRDGEGDAAFEGLLSSLVAGREKPAGQDTATEGGATSRDLGRRMAEWFSGNGVVLEGEGGSDALDTTDGELADASATADTACEASLVAPIDASAALVDTPRSAPNMSTLAVTPPVAAPAPAVPPGAPPADARQSLLPDMPSEPVATSSARSTPAPEEPAEVAVATATVVGRETHLAPARDAAAFAGQLQKGSDSATGQPPAPDTSSPGGEPKGSAAAAGAAAPHPPATATGGQNAGTGARSQQGREGHAARQASPETQVTSTDARATADASSEQVGQVARAEAQANVPPAAPGPVQQIAARIASEVGAAAQAGRPAAGFVPFTQAHLGAPVRVLQIQLQPLELGTVTVRISLKDQALRLDVEVGRGDTAQLIQRERETLSALLRGAGYLVDGLDVRMVDQMTPGQQATGGGGQAGMQMPGDGQGSSSQADGRSPHARQQDQRRDNPFGNGRTREDDQAGTPARRSDLYV